MQPRYEKITSWLEGVYPNQHLSLEKLKGDASLRHYYRLNVAGKRYVVMDAPPEHLSISPFIHATTHFEKAGLRVPKIFHENEELGALILEDFGNAHYLESLNDDSADALYCHAIDCIIRLQTYQPEQTLNRFDASHIALELSVFYEWYLSTHCHINHFDLSPVRDTLIQACLAQPFVTIHRDFHSRNLMVLSGNLPGVLDHQDLMLGPLMYDLVSLLKDCYITWPPAKVQAWLDYFVQQRSLEPATAKYWFDMTGVQRHLKAIGTFARLAHFYNNPDYLKYIPATLGYILPVAERTPALKTLATLIQEHLL